MNAFVRQQDGFSGGGGSLLARLLASQNLSMNSSVNNLMLVLL